MFFFTILLAAAPVAVDSTSSLEAAFQDAAASRPAPAKDFSRQGAQVTEQDRKDFWALLAWLPTNEEFFAEEVVDRAAPYLPVLLALTPQDLAGRDLHPLLAITAQLCERKAHQDYLREHFDQIEDPFLRLSVAALLFKERNLSPEIDRFLKRALTEPEQSTLLQRLTESEWYEFKDAITRYPATRGRNRNSKRPGSGGYEGPFAVKRVGPYLPDPRSIELIVADPATAEWYAIIYEDSEPARFAAGESIRVQVAPGLGPFYEIRFSKAADPGSWSPTLSATLVLAIPAQ